MTQPKRVLLISNRLPITARVMNGELRIESSAGGLATGLRSLHQESDGRWIGWPGSTDGLPPDTTTHLAAELEKRRLVPVDLSAEEVHRYYEGYSNGVLWPLFHYMPGRLPLENPDWEVYERVNRRFADAIVAAHRPGDAIWIHDYQLMLCPGMVRERLPDARIGFFLHIPFPASEIFRILPHRAHLLAGLLGADVIGFHTAAYLRHFATSALRLLGATVDVEHVGWQGRRVALGVFPMGIDAAGYAARAAEPAVDELVRTFRADPEVRVLVGIDRLDYSKGLPRRLLAFEKLLQTNPELRGKVRLVQVAVPSRTEVEAYREFRQEIDAIIGRIVGEFATPNWVPIHYLYRSLTDAEIVALYRAADVMLVTPLRDGMNLVAKEFAAARVDGDGVLVLSEFAGAAAELAEAVHVNPYDTDGTAAAIHTALVMPEDERRTRMSGLRRRVFEYDVLHWVRSFLLRLAETPGTDQPASTAAAVEDALGRVRRAHRLVLLLDYDGTLVPFAPRPELARPDAGLLALLRGLASRARTEVHILSGRVREPLDKWFGDLPVGLHAEHGFWSRPAGSKEWIQVGGAGTDVSWMARVGPILDQFADRVPGAFVERKTASLAWHWRSADPEFGALQANELRLHLLEILSNAPVAVLAGERMVEVRPHAVNKGLVLSAIPAATSAASLCVAMGDGVSDEELFAAVPEGALTAKVGAGPTRAHVVLEDVIAARTFLRSLL